MMSMKMMDRPVKVNGVMVGPEQKRCFRELLLLFRTQVSQTLLICFYRSLVWIWTSKLANDNMYGGEQRFGERFGRTIYAGQRGAPFITSFWKISVMARAFSSGLPMVHHTSYRVAVIPLFVVGR